MAANNTQPNSTTNTANSTTQTPDLAAVRAWLAGLAEGKTPSAPTHGTTALASAALGLLPGLGALCLCGCGAVASRGSSFLPGHDAKAKAALVRRALDGDKAAEEALADRRWSGFLAAAQERAAGQAAKAEQKAAAKEKREQEQAAAKAAREAKKAEEKAAKPKAAPKASKPAKAAAKDRAAQKTAGAGRAAKTA